MTNPYTLLLEPVRIGPVTAPNRFYQVPHCNGMGYRMPRALAAMRGVKAEGGWGVVCTEEVEIHHSSDLAPYLEGRLWSDDDIPALALMAEAVHRHGALAGIELTHNGHDAMNYYSRATSLGPRSIGLMGRHRFRAGSVSSDGPGRHSQSASLAPQCGVARQTRRFRHYLLLCRARLESGDALLAAPVQ